MALPGGKIHDNLPQDVVEEGDECGNEETLGKRDGFVGWVERARAPAPDWELAAFDALYNEEGGQNNKEDDKIGDEHGFDFICLLHLQIEPLNILRFRSDGKGKLLIVDHKLFGFAFVQFQQVILVMLEFKRHKGGA